MRALPQLLTIIAILFVGIGGVATWLLMHRTEINEDNFRRLRPNMTKTQVEQVLGSPEEIRGSRIDNPTLDQTQLQTWGNKLNIQRDVIWFGKGGRIWVGFDDSDHVVFAEFVSYTK